MGLLSKLKAFFLIDEVSQNKTNSLNDSPKMTGSSIHKEENNSSVEYSMKLEDLLKPTQKQDINLEYVFSTIEQIEQLSIEDTNNKRFRKITGAVKPTEVVNNKYGTFVGMCEIEEDDISAWGEAPTGEKVLFYDLYSKDLNKLLKLNLGEIKIPFIAYAFTDFDYLDKTNAYYTNEERTNLYFYLGEKNDVIKHMKEDLIKLNEKVQIDMINRKRRYSTKYL